MIRVRNEEWLSDDQKEALRLVNENKEAKKIYKDALRRGWDEHAALLEVYDWWFYEGSQEKR